jgi:hypothetical protein
MIVHEVKNLYVFCAGDGLFNTILLNGSCWPVEANCIGLTYDNAMGIPELAEALAGHGSAHEVIVYR